MAVSSWTWVRSSGNEARRRSLMQLFPLLLIVIVLAADGGLRLFVTTVAPLEAALLAVAPVALIFSAAWFTMILCERRLSRGGTFRSIANAERTVRYGRGLLLLNHAAAVLCFGWLDAVRSLVGDLILIDELITIAPPLIGAVGLWWVYYPIERRLRDSLLVRRLDLGKPVYAMPTRAQYVSQQLRTGMLILLVPVVLILGIGETIQFAAMRWADAQSAMMIANGATLLAAATVFMCAPLLMRLLLHVEPLPQGEMRADLMYICACHNVRVRELLLWKTGGSMINAAVMGLLGRLRYVLVTDALVETMSEQQLKAVMAHEVGHVRRHHMPWLVVCFAAALFGTLWLIELPLVGLQAMAIVDVRDLGQWFAVTVMAAQVVLALVVFGWVCRRFERQADTFAVQHLSASAPADENGGETTHVSLEAVHAMCGALETIAQLNAVDRHRPSWRHGSIAWRQRYLASIVGQPLRALAIDTFIKRIKLISTIVLALTLGAWLLL